MSSSNPRGTRVLGERLAEHGGALVDAPVSGGVVRAKTGELVIMVGGDDEEAVGRAEPVLRVLGARLFRTGPLGSGHAMKAGAEQLPVREAIRRLEAEGLVVYRPNAGAQVAPAEPGVFDEEMSVLAVLEGMRRRWPRPRWTRPRSVA